MTTPKPQESARSRHTPGPWEFIYGSVYKQDGRGFSEEGLRIALMDRNEPRTEPCERDANARLIAAAPELLVRFTVSPLEANHDQQT